MTRGADLLDEVEQAIRKYTIQSGDDEYRALTLYVAMSHAAMHLDFAPRLCLTSPVKRCGKSRTLEILSALCHAPLSSANASAAALYRSIPRDGGTRTIFIDEADTLFKPGLTSSRSEDLRNLLNSGFRRGDHTLRCDGPSNAVVEFNTFSPVVIAGIGGMPETVTDRAVNVRLRRKLEHEQISAYRLRIDEPELHALRDRLAAWVYEIGTAAADHRPTNLPLKDRAADVWEPLITIADMAHGTWPQRAREAAVSLQKAHEDQEVLTPGLELLNDIRTALRTLDGQQVSSTALTDALERVEGSRWEEEGISTRALARYLREFDIEPRRLKGGRVRGYDVRVLRSAMKRYLPTVPSDATESVKSVKRRRRTS